MNNSCKIHILFFATIATVFSFFPKQTTATVFTNSTKHVKIDSVLKTEVYGGVYGSGITVTYSIYFKAKRKNIVLNDSAWSENHCEKMDLRQGKSSVKVYKLKKKDSYLALVSFHINPENNTITCHPPIVYSGKILIAYTYKKKRYFLSLNNIKSLHKVYLP